MLSARNSTLRESGCGMWRKGGKGLGAGLASLLFNYDAVLIGLGLVGGFLSLEDINNDDGIQIALDAIENGRLALICGAGLSMGPPSNIPSAQTLADQAKEKYDATFGAERPPLPSNIEEQARLFFQQGQLGNYYLRTLIGRHAFSADPNAAHFAVADFLLTRAADLAVSTNVDRLIETAGMLLKGHIETAIDRDRAAAAPADTSVLFKLHGCWDQDPDNTLWCEEQLQAAPLDQRIAQATEWLSMQLLDRDVVVVGFFTHWPHLSDVLASALQAVRPARLLIVDPADAAWLEEKAPGFYAIGQHAQRFCHVATPGDLFLDQLRAAFSRGFIRKSLHGGRHMFQQARGNPPDAAWLEPASPSSEDLWRIRRDLEGCLPSEPATMRGPAEEPALGFTLLQLRAAGGSWAEAVMMLEDRVVRVFRGRGRSVHDLKAAFERSVPPLNPETVIAVGAIDLPLKPNVARETEGSTITRGTGRRWITRETAVAEFGL
jgi:hypothetical protein